MEADRPEEPDINSSAKLGVAGLTRANYTDHKLVVCSDLIMGPLTELSYSIIF